MHGTLTVKQDVKTCLRNRESASASKIVDVINLPGFGEKVG